MLSLQHLVAHPRQAGAASPPCIVLLHGRGADERDLFGLVPELPAGALVVSVRAPLPFQWGGGYAWYDLSGPVPALDATSLVKSVEQLGSFLIELPQHYTFDPTQLFMVGFSQGAMMAAGALLTQPEVVAGSAVLSGHMPAELPFAINPAVAGKPVFQAHGTEDELLTVVQGRQARLHLEGLGLAVEYHEYVMGHQITPAELTDLRSWFAGRGVL